MAKRGALIVFEGCDRSGKTTQCKMLVDALNEQGLKSSMLRFPDRSTSIGKVCANYLQQSIELDDHAIHLMFSANRWELKSHILSLLKIGVNVIIDRYSFSGVAFSAAKQGMDMEWCKKPEVGLPKPDTVIFLDLNEDVQRKRGGYGGERYETEEMQKSVRNNYKQLVDGSWIIIEADRTPVDLHTELLILVKRIISENREEEVGKLWV